MPNPASEWLTVKSPISAIEKIELLTLEGRPLPLVWTGNASEVDFDLSLCQSAFF
ncbi:MAG: hypothetical protein IPM82_14685 [Saprospiraceae bacterium]|nr:hypothetical protein [Saprospiraceae bacterium]